VEQRSVYCVRERDDGTFQAAVSDDLCSGTKPASLRRCNEQPCPAWFTGVWSPVRLYTPYSLHILLQACVIYTSHEDLTPVSH